MVRALHATITLAVLCGTALLAQDRGEPPVSGDQAFRFRSGVELINVTATVSDERGRFVPGLTADDFAVYEDGVPQTVTHFSAERVPVSLGMVVDTSGSMVGEKIEAARSALRRFFGLLDRDDEIFVYRFSDDPQLLQDWTSDPQDLARALRRLTPNGATAMYDAVGEAIPLAQSGRHRKKSVVIISDGNDTTSRTRVSDLKRLIRESEVLVYAIGIDGDSSPSIRQVPQPRSPIPFPSPFPQPGRPGGRRWPGIFPQTVQPQIGGWSGGRTRDDRVNVSALRELTDDSGGRTEIIREAQDLGPATAGIADELSRQYYLGYPASGKKDGQWHSIRVEVRDRDYRVRARRGYVAS